MANAGGSKVSEFAPGSTTPSAALTALSVADVLAVDVRSNLFVANAGADTVSEFALKPAAGGVVIRTAQPGQSISVGATSGTGLAISNAELARIFTTGAITFGDPSQTGTITFAAATPRASVVALQSPTGPGTIVLDDASGTALAAGTGSVSLTAGSGGIVATGSDTTAAIGSSGQVTLNTKGGVGSSAHRVVFDAAQTPSAVVVGDTSAPGSGVYLSGLGALTLEDVATTSAPLDVTAAAGLTVAANALLDTGTGTISLAADVNVDGTGNSNSGALSIASGATVLSVNARKSAITLRGATIVINTGPAPAVVVGARRAGLPSTPSATLTGLNQPNALAFDGSGNLFVANRGFHSRGTTVSEFAPGSIIPTATLTGLNGPAALASDARGNLFVANGNGTTVSEFAPGSTTPTATLTGLDDPAALAFDARGDLFVANLKNDTVSQFTVPPPVPTAGGVVIRTAQPGQPISIGTNSGTGLAISNAELAQIFTTASGAITFGDPSQTGTITFAAATPATTPGESVIAVQSGSGSIVLNDASGTALAAGAGNVSLTAGSGGIVATGSDTTATAIATTGQVTLNTKGGVGSSANPIVFDAKRTPASVVVGDSSAPGSGVYRAGLGALTLGEVRTQSAPLDVTANALTARGAISAGNVTLTATALTVNAGASVMAGTGDALSVTADTLTLQGILSAGSTGIVTLKPFTTTRNIDLGGTGPTTDLVLGDSDLGRVTAGTLRIGDATADTGDIDVTGSLSSHPGYATLSLQTQTGSINEANGATLTVANLALQAGSGIGTSGNLHTAVTNLSLANQSGAIHISNTGAVTLTNVDTLIGSSIPGNIDSSPVVGNVYTLLHSSGVKGQISYNGRALADGSALVLSDGIRYQISYRSDGGEDVTLKRIATVASFDLLGQTIRAGQSAGIGFWANANGQALIRSFDGGPTSRALADWLAATLPTLYGAGAGPHDVTGLTNAKVAELLRKLSRARASRPEAQVLATALDVYATTRSLRGRAARRDGFRVTAAGLGATAYTIGARGDALGVRSQTVLDVDQILEAANERAVDAVLDDGNATLRHRVDELFTEINTGK